MKHEGEFRKPSYDLILPQHRPSRVTAVTLGRWGCPSKRRRIRSEPPRIPIMKSLLGMRRRESACVDSVRVCVSVCVAFDI